MPEMPPPTTINLRVTDARWDDICEEKGWWTEAFPYVGSVLVKLFVNNIDILIAVPPSTV